jgi:hypothetical protein
MKVKELINYLKEYGEDTRVSIFFENKLHYFNIAYKGSDGGTKKDAEEVFLEPLILDNKENKG